MIRLRLFQQRPKIQGI